MIALHEECLLIERSGGGYLPCPVEQLSFEIVGGGSGVDPELLRHAAAAVLHYFREELGRVTVTLGEFSTMLIRVLEGLGIKAEVTDVRSQGEVRIADLRVLANGEKLVGELEFYPRLRAFLREQLAAGPLRLEFRGLRGCVKRLAGRKHWCPACERKEAELVGLIRGWFEQATAAVGAQTALVLR